MSPSQTPSSLTFEQIAAEADKFDLAALEQATANGPRNESLAIDPSAICNAYNIVKPVLQFLANLPFIPSKYRQALTIFINFMNGICG